MLKLNTAEAKTFTILLPNTNKALNEVLKTITPKEHASLSNAKDLGSLLDSLIKSTAGDRVQNQQLLDLLKSTPSLKSLGNVAETFKDLKELLGNNRDLPLTKETKTKLEEAVREKLNNTPDNNAKTLKKNLENSGIFLESKLYKATENQLQKESFSHDLKALVNKTVHELQESKSPHTAELNQQLQKLSLQIDYYQLLSSLNNASALYLPYSFDALEDGTLTIKKRKEEHFFCDIDLQLKKYGNLFLRLGLFQKKELNITIQCESEILEEQLKKNLPNLRENLFQAGLHPQNIHFTTPSQQSESYGTQPELALGFEVKA